MDMNQVFLVGRLAEDVKFFAATEGRSARATGRLMVNRPPNQSGKRTPDAINIVAWGKHAENMFNWTGAGKELTIVGEIRVNNVRPTRDGEKWQNFTEILIQRVSFGKDSQSGKLIKALSGSDEEVQAAFDAFGTPEEIKALLNTEKAKKLLSNAKQGSIVRSNRIPSLNPRVVIEDVLADTEAEEQGVDTNSPFKD